MALKVNKDVMTVGHSVFSMKTAKQFGNHETFLPLLMSQNKIHQ